MPPSPWHSVPPAQRQSNLFLFGSPLMPTPTQIHSQETKPQAITMETQRAGSAHLGSLSPTQGGSGRNKLFRKVAPGLRSGGRPQGSPEAYLEITSFLGARRCCSGSPGGRQHTGRSRPAGGARGSRHTPSLSYCQQDWLFGHSVMSNSLRPHGPQHTRLPCPSPSPGGGSNSCPFSW